MHPFKEGKVRPKQVMVYIKNSDEIHDIDISYLFALITSVQSLSTCSSLLNPIMPTSNEADYATLQEAIYDYVTNNESLLTVAKSHNLSDWTLRTLRRTYHRWIKSSDGSQPQSPTDIHIPTVSVGRPTFFTATEEARLEEVVMYFVDQNTPLTKSDLKEVVMHFTLQLPQERKQRVPFLTSVLSDKWINGFLRRHPSLVCKSMKAIEDSRTCAVTRDTVGEHIARLQAAQQRFSIRDPRRIFNLDESGISFRSMTNRSLRKGIGTRSRNLVTTNVRRKGNMDKVTIMPIVSAAGEVHTPTIVYPGKTTLYRKVNGTYETLHQYLPACHLFHREIAGVDMSILFQAMERFIEEMTDLRRGGQKLLLLIDGYAAHVRYSVLNLLKSNGIIVIGLPAHTSHVLQPLDVSVFGPYKSYFQKHLHRAAREKRVLDACDVAHIIRLSYSESFTVSNVLSGFEKTGVWDSKLRLASITWLKDLPYYGEEANKENILPSVEEVVRSWTEKSRSLLRCYEIEEDGHVRVATTTGAHLTDSNILRALLARDRKRQERLEARDDREKMISLAFARAIRRYSLDRSGKFCRERQKRRICRTRQESNLVQ